MLRLMRNCKMAVAVISGMVCLSFTQSAAAKDSIDLDIPLKNYGIGITVPFNVPKLDKAALKRVAKIAAAATALNALIKKISPPKGKVAPVKGKAMEKLTIDTVEKWARSGDMRAQYVMGYACYFGYQRKKNITAGVEWWCLAAAQGQADAAKAVGIAKENRLKKIPLAELVRNMGVDAYQSRFRQRKQGEAVKWWQLGIRLNDKKAPALLGTAYFIGYDGIKKDEKKATALFLEGVKNHDTLAQYELGRAYLYGRGVGKNTDLALGLLNEAAKHGISEAGVLVDKILSNELH